MRSALFCTVALCLLLQALAAPQFGSAGSSSSSSSSSSADKSRPIGSSSGTFGSNSGSSFPSSAVGSPFPAGSNAGGSFSGSPLGGSFSGGSAGEPIPSGSFNPNPINSQSSFGISSFGNNPTDSRPDSTFNHNDPRPISGVSASRTTTTDASTTTRGSIFG